MTTYKFENRSSVIDAIESEGLVYFVTGYSRPSQMPDEVLEEIYNRAELKYNEFLTICEELFEEAGGSSF